MLEASEMEGLPLMQIDLVPLIKSLDAQNNESNDILKKVHHMLKT